MAVAGGNTWAYYVQLREDGTIKPSAPGDAATLPWLLLPSVADAVARILKGERVAVAGPDVFKVREMVLLEVGRRASAQATGGDNAD